MCCTVTYLMTTMTLGTVSVCMTVLVLNVHHRGAETRMSPWLRRLTLVHLARFVGVRTSVLDAVRGGRQPSIGLGDGSTQPPPPTLTTASKSGFLRRRPAPRQEQRDGDRGGRKPSSGGDSTRTLSCHYVPLDGVANDVAAADITTTDNDVKFFQRPTTADTPRNGPTSLDLRVPSLMLSYGRRWRRHQQLQQQQRRRWLFDASGSVVGDRLSRSGGDLGLGSRAGRSPPASPSLPRAMTAANDDDDDTHLAETVIDRGLTGLSDSAADESDVIVTEWTELARVLDRTFFWLLFALMTLSAIVILLYPKYTGNEDGWTFTG